MALAHHSKIMDSLTRGEERSKVSGVLCNDANGLCLISKGALRAEDSGIYSTLVRLASLLSPSQGTHGGLAIAGITTPLITLESEAWSALIKEYDGRTVAIRVPSGGNEKPLQAESKESVEAK